MRSTGLYLLNAEASSGDHTDTSAIEGDPATASRRDMGGSRPVGWYKKSRDDGNRKEQTSKLTTRLQSRIEAMGRSATTARRAVRVRR